jgi:two-component system, NarL family, nitrate/nitrite response regulator NarL
VVRHSPSTSTVIVGQHTLLREGLAALLQHSTYKVIASAGNASDLKDIRVTSDRQPLAILTIDDTVGSPAEAADNIRALRARFTCPTIVVIAETRNPVDIQKITSLTPNAYIANLTSRELLLRVLDLLALAQPVLVLSASGTTTPPSDPLARPEPLEGPNGNGHGPTCTSGVARDGEGPPFSQRERQILCQLSRGSSNKEIARLFSITESTVKVHLKALLRKIGARNRTQAAIWAVGRDYLVSSPLAQSAEHSLRPNATDPPAPLTNKLVSARPVPLLAMRPTRTEELVGSAIARRRS